MVATWPKKPSFKPLKAKRLGQNGVLIWLVSPDLFEVVLRNLLYLIIVQAWNAFGIYWATGGRQNRYRFPPRIRDGRSSDDCPATLAHVETFLRNDWYTVSDFYEVFRWETRRMPGGEELPLELMRAEYAMYAGIAGRLDELLFTWEE